MGSSLIVGLVVCLVSRGQRIRGKTGKSLFKRRDLFRLLRNTDEKEKRMMYDEEMLFWYHWGYIRGFNTTLFLLGLNGHSLVVFFSLFFFFMEGVWKDEGSEKTDNIRCIWYVD